MNTSGTSSVRNLLAGRHTQLQNLLRERISFLRKRGCLYTDEAEALSAKIQNYPENITCDDLSSLQSFSFRCQTWRIPTADKLLSVLPANADRRLVQSLKEDKRVLFYVQEKTSSSLLEFWLDAIIDGFKIVAQYWTKEVESMAAAAKVLGFLVVGLPHCTPNEHKPSADNPDNIRLLSAERLQWEINRFSTDKGVVIDSVSLFLSARSRTDLRRRSELMFGNVSGDRVVVSCNPSSEQIHRLPRLGSLIHMTTNEILSNETIQAAAIRIIGPHKRLFPKNLISIISSAAPIGSLASSRISNVSLREDIKPLRMEGVLGLVSRGDLSKADRKIISPDWITGHEVETEITFADLKLDNDKTGSGIRDLAIFDFDGTLFCTPNEFRGKEEYLDATGTEFPHKGYYGRPESLMPPLRVFPGPALSECMSIRSKPNTRVIILTARIERVRAAVENILRLYDVHYDELICKERGTGQLNSDYKEEAINNLLLGFKGVTKVTVWDDSTENLVRFYEMKRTLADTVNMEVVDASNMSIPRNKNGRNFSWEHQIDFEGIESYFDAKGRIPRLEQWIFAEGGIQLLLSIWSRTLEIDLQLKKLFVVNGSYPFRVFMHPGDPIELTLALPNVQSPVEIIARFQDLLARDGIQFETIGENIQCRLCIEGGWNIAYSVRFQTIKSERLHLGLDALVKENSGWSSRELAEDIEMQEKVALAGIADVLPTAVELLRCIANSRSDRETSSCPEISVRKLVRVILANRSGESDTNRESVDQFCKNLLVWITGQEARTLSGECELSADEARTVISGSSRFLSYFSGNGNKFPWSYLHDAHFGGERVGR